MKKIICLILATVVLLLSVGCNQQEPSSPTGTSNEVQNSESLEISVTESLSENEDYSKLGDANILFPDSLTINPPIEKKSITGEDVRKLSDVVNLGQALDILGMYENRSSSDNPFFLYWNAKYEDTNINISIKFYIDKNEEEQFWADLDNGKFRLPSEKVTYNSNGIAYATPNEIKAYKDFYLNVKAITARVNNLLEENHSIVLFSSDKDVTYPINIVMPAFNTPKSYSSDLRYLDNVKKEMTMEEVFEVLEKYPWEIDLSSHPFKAIWAINNSSTYATIYFKADGFEADSYEEFWQRFNNGEFVLPDEEIKYEQYTGKRYATENEIKAYKELYLKSRVIKVEKYENGKTTVLVDVKQ